MVTKIVTPSARKLVDQVPELAAADRVDARGGLVEEDDRRLVEDRAAQGQPLLPAAREDGRRLAAVPGQPRHFDHPLLPRPFLFPRDAVDAAVEVDVLLDGEVLVEREFLAHVADVGFDLFGLGADIEAGHGARAAAGAEDAAEHADGGRLARPVRAQEAEDLALLDLEADAIDGHEVAEPLFQVVDHDGGIARVIAHDRRKTT